ncbi:MAG TPA: diacylglycerol kinase family protein [Thermoanaerobaculia bacterium]
MHLIVSDVNSLDRLRIPLPVVLNRSAGGTSGDEIPDRIREAFRGAGAEADVRIAASGEELVAFAREAASGQSPIVVVAGGDGSVASVVSVIAWTGKALGVLPLGTLNHFAKDLRIPLELEAAAHNVVEGLETQVDLGEVNGRIFVNNSSLGLYPRIVRHREESRQKLGWGKWPALLWATLHTLHRHRPIDVALSVDGSEIRRQTPFVFIGNNFYEMEGFDVGTRSRLDRGELSVYLAPGARPRDLVFFAIRALLGLLRRTSGFEVLRTSELTIRPRANPVRVATDGELAMLPTPLKYRVMPRALHVIVPEESPIPEEGRTGTAP